MFGARKDCIEDAGHPVMIDIFSYPRLKTIGIRNGLDVLKRECQKELYSGIPDVTVCGGVLQKQ
jgi:hypothetical protein